MLGKLNRVDIENLLEAIQNQDTSQVLDLAKVTFSKVNLLGVVLFKVWLTL